MWFVRFSEDMFCEMLFDFNRHQIHVSHSIELLEIENVWGPSYFRQLIEFPRGKLSNFVTVLSIAVIGGPAYSSELNH